MKTISVIHDIEITPKLLAQAFTEMFDDQQREFFEELARIWNDENLDFDTQMYHVRHNGEISRDALDIMNMIGKE